MSGFFYSVYGKKEFLLTPWNIEVVCLSDIPNEIIFSKNIFGYKLAEVKLDFTNNGSCKIIPRSVSRI